jgi:hypothetical protein
MIVDKIIVGNVTVEQRQFFEAGELDVRLYRALVLFISFVLSPSKVFVVMRARLHWLPSRRVLALRKR